jgi:5-methylcytosine-specific restriction protein A
VRRRTGGQYVMSRHSHLYNNARWRARRRQHLLHHPLCVLCAGRGRIRAATHADHVALHGGDLDKFWHGELQSLCATCHSGAKQSEEHTGRRCGCDANGKPFDQSHPVDVKERR